MGLGLRFAVSGLKCWVLGSRFRDVGFAISESLGTVDIGFGDALAKRASNNQRCSGCAVSSYRNLSTTVQTTTPCYARGSRYTFYDLNPKP